MNRIREKQKLAFSDGDIEMVDFMSDILYAMTKLVAVSVAMTAIRNVGHGDEPDDVLSEALWCAEFLIDPNGDDEDDA